MKPKHTQGPWRLRREVRRDEYAIQIKEDGFEKVIATVETGFDEPWESQQHANARLIAAAPQMLSALYQCAAYLSDLEDVVDGDYGEPAPNKEMTLLVEVRAAIAKAEGGKS